MWRAEPPGRAKYSDSATRQGLMQLPYEADIADVHDASRRGRRKSPAMAEQTVTVTTSWDDGHELDARLADVLNQLGFAATFYISPLSWEIPPRQRLSAPALREIAKGFEIGSHTLTHPRLTKLSAADAAREIQQGKDAAEQAVGLPVTSFCYPYGAYRAEHIDLVRAAGFRVGRTTRRFHTDGPADPLQLATTTHAARYKADVLLIARNSLSAGVGQAIKNWHNWDVMARHLFDQARAAGGVYHLWGHSWEIERHQDWARLRSLLEYIAGHDGIRFVTNGELERDRRAIDRR
jgi:peptidoglycan-N-acetylglucosamine deacetylase